MWRDRLSVDEAARRVRKKLEAEAEKQRKLAQERMDRLVREAEEKAVDSWKQLTLPGIE